MMPATPRYTANASLGRTLEGFCRTIGIDLRAITNSLGLDLKIFQQDGVRINLEKFTELLHRLALLTDCDHLGICYGEFYSLADTGAFGFGILNCQTLREAVDFYKYYQQLVADYVFFDIRTDEGTSSIEWRSAGVIKNAATYVDFRSVLKLKMLRYFLGQQFMPTNVELVRALPRSILEHKRAFGPKVQFDALMNRITFPTRLLDTTAADSDPRLLRVLKIVCDDQLKHLQARKGVEARVREKILATLPKGGSNLASVASELGMTERSLQRRLSDHGAKFEVLIDETRRELSDNLLTSPAPLADIASLCGFSDASAYSRAAKSWYGEPPSVRRAKLTQ